MLEPDKGESEGQIFLPEAEVRKRFLQRDGIKKRGGGVSWGVGGNSGGHGSSLELSKVYLKLSDLLIQVRTDQRRDNAPDCSCIIKVRNS